MSIFKRLVAWERDLRQSYNTDLSTPENRRRAKIYNMWFDHAVLRKFWTNHYPVAEGVWRSNQPTHARFERLKAAGFRTVLNLRGAGGAAHYLVEEESCAKLGLRLVNVTLHARFAAPRSDIAALLKAFREIERPFVMHCKSGADRAGFASAIYLMVMEGRSVDEARRMLSLKYMHIRQSKTGVLGYILDLYEARQAETGIGFEDWVMTEYDNMAVQTAFEENFKPRF
ncbi:tyrosine-protein phosphatase [Roseovarius sp. LXJ103]|uniref:fused DSP-PTPase phosphatase/NAD kinase-like protein n=1 Tax=Roseovarius carneus TaxID=2853164 RepID=UPI000D610944|nr:tyrosine-protein phosphatase [Roseovarius carneus]MBZ8117203.1 tyrosine-protein phosphatase [Roseovarius carneus]PWE37403.1 protein tyrosine phosphatase [Pelagicola sp. LXJ1103]